MTRYQTLPAMPAPQGDRRISCSHTPIGRDAGAIARGLRVAVAAGRRTGRPWRRDFRGQAQVPQGPLRGGRRLDGGDEAEPSPTVREGQDIDIERGP